MILTRTLKEIATEVGKNYRTIKKIAILVEKKTKNWKIVKVGYIMPDDLLLFKQKEDEQDFNSNSRDG